MKLSLDEVKLTAKLKENSIKNFYSITEHKLNFGNIFNYGTGNKIIYKHNNHFFKFGYFNPLLLFSGFFIKSNSKLFTDGKYFKSKSKLLEDSLLKVIVSLDLKDFDLDI